MFLKKSQFTTLFQVAYTATVAVGFSYLIGLATQLGILLIAAIPLGVLLVALLCWLPSRAQLLSWSAITVWLLSTVYLGSSDLEYVMLVVVLIAAIAGALWSPWFLAAIWFIHPLWDLIPRELPEIQQDLPLACLMYDLVVAFYLLWRIRRGFFDGAVVTPANPSGVLKTGLSRTLTALVMLIVLIAQILVVGVISMEEISAWLAAPVAVALIASTLWLPLEGKKAFWLVFTMWTGMTFAHSGQLLEIAVFGLMIIAAVLGYQVSMYYWAMAWAFHGLWHLLPRDHLSHEAAMLMGHWMIPSAGLVFEISIAVYLAWFAWRQGQRVLK